MGRSSVAAPISEVRLDVELLPCEHPDAPVLGSKASGEPVPWHGVALAPGFWLGRIR